ncbi:MAG: VWA domain-containing protein [Acidobacteriaceae bacterium]|nr:VWA domain-containing protein [Acidobacteriaceae bacterium]
MTFFGRKKNREYGQIIPLFALMLVVLILMIGLAIDLGYAYLTKAALSKAVDAACLAGMRNLGQGSSRARTVAQSAFTANYGVAPSRDTAAPTVNVAFSTDGSNNTLLTVTAQTTINTFFIRILPQWQTLTISASAQSTRPQLIMSLILDRSGSMTTNGGSSALPPAVNNFLTYFDENVDQLALITFSSTSTVNISMRTMWKTAMTNAVNSMPFGGGTFSVGGLSDGKTQIDRGVSSGQNVVKVAVFFTDGYANTAQDSLGTCGIRNYGGYDAPQTSVAILFPNSGSIQCTANYPPGPTCCGSTFPSQITNTSKPFSETNVTAEAEYRAIQMANAMRAEGITVYSIGLGNSINQQFLYQIANDPNSPTFDSSQPVGEADFAPQASDLNQVFQTIASKILLRLTQ